MINKISQFFLIITLTAGLLGTAQAAEGLKPLLTGKITYNESGKGKISWDSHKQAETETQGNKIQMALLFYAYAMNQLPADKTTPVLNATQRIVSKVATEQGLMRPDVLANNPLVSKVPATAKDSGFEIVFGSLAGKGNALEVKPIGDASGLWASTVFYLFQDVITNGSDSGLRLFALALGGTNKWYRETGKPSDPQSVSQAPAFGLNLAVDIIAKITGSKL